MIAALGVPLTERLSFGAAFTIGTGFLDGPFTDLGGMTTAYGIRGTIGATYELSSSDDAGRLLADEKALSFRGRRGVQLQRATFDLSFDHPENVGLGIADESLMDGRLLLAMDVLYKQYSNADFLQLDLRQPVGVPGRRPVHRRTRSSSCASATRTTRTRCAARRRLTIGGVPLPDGVPGLRYIQGQFAAIGQHHVTGGVGISNLLPGVDSDLLVGGMFKETDQFASTIASVESYWVGTYLTWRFGSGDSH